MRRTRTPPTRVFVLFLAGGVLGFLGIAILVALRVFVFQPYRIPAASMLPTLQVGQHLVGDRRLGEVERGDVLIFEFPADRDVDYIKRVIGLPGELVEVANNRVYIDGEPLERTRVDEVDWTDASCRGNRSTQYQEGDGERSWPILLNPRVGSRLAHWGPETVPPDSYFVLGDNRDNSSDSRVWGYVPADHLKARQRWLMWRFDPCGG